MKERPILFSGSMVRALLADTKTQTRRIVKPQPYLTKGSGFSWKGYVYGQGSDHADTVRNFVKWTCPYGQPGDRLWVRETWAEVGTLDPGFIVYKADYPASVPAHLENVPRVDGVRWKPSIHMFRTDSRITLEVTAVRVERLQDISAQDAIAEGIEEIKDNSPFGNHGLWRDYSEDGGMPFNRDAPVSSYRTLWESINGPGSWDADPWVWVVEFKRV